MLFQSLRVLCLAPGGSGSVSKYLEALVRSLGVSGRIACSFQSKIHFADAAALEATLNVVAFLASQIKMQSPVVASEADAVPLLTMWH